MRNEKRDFKNPTPTIFVNNADRKCYAQRDFKAHKPRDKEVMAAATDCVARLPQAKGVAPKPAGYHEIGGKPTFAKPTTRSPTVCDRESMKCNSN